METIFVFGSNKAGRHGKGAALHAKKVWGAEQGVGEGLTGRAYALPTKDERIRSMPLDQVLGAIRRFITFAREHPEMLFLLTPVGCGLAGNDAQVIAAFVRTENPPDNIALTLSWFDHLI